MQIMDYSAIEQIKDLCKRSQNILIVFNNDSAGDAVSSALALRLFLEKIKKNPAIVCSQFNPSDNYAFLPKFDSIQKDLPGLRKFVISLDISKHKIKELSYEAKDNRLNIYITPQIGFFDAHHLSTSVSPFAYDLIFSLDSPKMKSLGPIFDENQDFFFQTPIINLGYRTESECFGQINLMETGASSVAEIIFQLIESFGPEHIDKDVATCLLSGVLSVNHSDLAAVNPQTFIAISQLIAKGADKETVVKNVCRQKSFHDFKFWGVSLGLLENEADKTLPPKTLWSLLKEDEIKKLENVSEEKFEAITEKILNDTPWIRAVILLYEKSLNEFLKKISGNISENKVVYGLAKTKNTVNALDLTRSFNSQGSPRTARFSIKDKNIEEINKAVLDEIKNNLSELVK